MALCTGFSINVSHEGNHGSVALWCFNSSVLGLAMLDYAESSTEYSSLTLNPLIRTLAFLFLREDCSNVVCSLGFHNTPMKDGHYDQDSSVHMVIHTCLREWEDVFDWTLNKCSLVYVTAPYHGLERWGFEAVFFLGDGANVTLTTVARACAKEYIVYLLIFVLTAALPGTSSRLIIRDVEPGVYI